jgi:nitrate/TMAO reductase-like tetraheme cytochrome c subunit
MKPLILVSIALVTMSGSAQSTKTSCLNCHEGQENVQHFKDDVHAEVGLSCHDCHGGNPDPAADMDVAKDRKFPGNPFRGAPERASIPDFCGKCHSSAEYMKRFNPAARVDQVTEYWTSGHGKRLKANDTSVATCIDCHSVHDIRRKANPEAPVYATNVAQTCSRCHSDRNLMAKYSIPTDQFARWRVSVHAKALHEKGDMSAPTCNDCHGNHGASPPGVESVSFVCGSCHAREAELFRASGKHEGWQQHNELLATGAKCADCHDDHRARIQVTHFGECVTCHENHAVLRPSVAMVGGLPDVPCAFCHEGTGPLAGLVPEPPKKASHYRELRGILVAAADRKGLSGSERFDWLVDQALTLPTHRMPATEAGAEPPLRPEFARLFEKFRIGKTRHVFKDVTISVRQCGDCHQGSGDAGTTGARHYLGATRNLTSMIARAERILLAAHRGGVEVRQARVELDSAVDNQIELETLVHTFGASDVQKKQDEGLQFAKAALVSAQTSLEELSYRRTGLFIALGIIIVVLVALAVKIRML